MKLGLNPDLFAVLSELFKNIAIAPVLFTNCNEKAIIIILNALDFFLIKPFFLQMNEEI